MGWLSALNPFRETDAAKAIRVLESRLEKLTKESITPVPSPFIPPHEYFDDWPGERYAYPRGYPQDKKHGENWPVIRHEDDLRLARATSRLLAETNPLCIGFLSHVTNFVVGPGFKWHVGLKGMKGDKDSKDPAVVQAQRFLDDFRALNGWGDTGEVSVGDGTDDDDSPSTDLEAEAFTSAMSDGEFFLRVFPGDSRTNGVPLVRRVNPECVRVPLGENHQGPWSFGIETDPEDRQRRLRYYVADPDAYPEGGEIVPAGEMVHLKLNAASDVKRGVPDLWPLEHEARHLRKLWQNMSEVSAILSAIAYIRQHAAGVTGTQITNLLDRTKSGTDTRGIRNYDQYLGEDVYRSYTRMEGGTVIDVTNGQEWVPPPIAAGIPGFTQAMQATLRIFGLRWGCPEYFSGDASNANFASTLVAGGPFERATQRRQRQFRIFQGNLASRVLLFGVKAGRLRREDVQRLSIAIDPPAVAIANKTEDTQRRATLNQAGVLSVRTWAAEEGLDPEAEAAQVKAEKAAQQPPPGMGGGGDLGAPVPGGDQPPDAGGGMDLATLLGEGRVRESFNETDHPRDDHGRFVSGADVADAKGDPAKEKALRDRVTDPAQRAKLDAELSGGSETPSPQEAAVEKLYAADYESWGTLENKLHSNINTPADLTEVSDSVDENRTLLDQFTYELADTLSEIGASDKAIDGVRAVLKKGLPVVDKLGTQYKEAATEVLAANQLLEAAEQEESEYQFQAATDEDDPDESDPPDLNDYLYDITQDDDAPDVPDKPARADYEYDIDTDSKAPPDPDDDPNEPQEPEQGADDEEWDAYYAAHDEWEAGIPQAREERDAYEAEQKAKAKEKYTAAKAAYKAAVKARADYEARKTAEWDAKYDAAVEAYESGRRPAKSPPSVDRTAELAKATKAARKGVETAERKADAIAAKYDRAIGDLENKLHHYALAQVDKIDIPVSESVITEDRPDGYLSDGEADTTEGIRAMMDDPDALGEGRVRESFNETDHPRDDHGRFVSGADVADAKGDPAKEKALRDRVTDPAQRAKLDAELGGGDPEDADEEQWNAESEAVAERRDEEDTERGRRQGKELDRAADKASARAERWAQRQDAELEKRHQVESSRLEKAQDREYRMRSAEWDGLGLTGPDREAKESELTARHEAEMDALLDRQQGEYRELHATLAAKQDQVEREILAALTADIEERHRAEDAAIESARRQEDEARGQRVPKRLKGLLGESVITEDRPDGYLPDGEAFFFESREGLVKKVITNKAGRKQTVYVRPTDDTARSDADKSVQAVHDSRTVVATAIGQVDRLTMSQMRHLADHVGNLNRDEIRAHLRTLGEKIGGAKVALAQRLVERIRAEHGKTEPFVQPRPEVGAKPAKTEPTADATVKQPWEMTTDEYAPVLQEPRKPSPIHRMFGNREHTPEEKAKHAALMKQYNAEVKRIRKHNQETTPKRYGPQSHDALVAQALADGKPVPFDVVLGNTELLDKFFPNWDDDRNAQGYTGTAANGVRYVNGVPQK